MAKKKTQRKTTTRKAATSKPAKKKAGGAKKSGAASARRPTWSIVTYEQIEDWRKQQGLPKKRMATLLGVTNSTYHNWARGIAVATYNTQRKIKDVLAGDAAPSTPVTAATRAAPKRSVGAEKASSHTTGGSTRLQELTIDLVKSYVEANPGKVTPEALIKLLGQVRSTLG